MDAVVILAGLAVLWLLMARFGHDSRERLRSPEERLAARGFTWADLADSGALPLLAREHHIELVRAAHAARPHPAAVPGARPATLGRVLARILRRLADRIDTPRPEIAPSPRPGREAQTESGAATLQGAH